MALASHLGMSKQRCQRETTSSEFVDWLVTMEIERSATKPEHYYLAQIAQEVRRVLSKNPNSVELKHFLLKFTSGKSGGADPYKDDPEAAAERSKSMWSSFMGAATKMGKGIASTVKGTMRGPKE